MPLVGRAESREDSLAKNQALGLLAVNLSSSLVKICL